MKLSNKVHALRDNQITELDDKDVDVELLSPSNFFSTHINLIPMHSAVQGPRLFYGARFYNQALPLVNGESPLVQNLDSTDPNGASFDEKLGAIAGAVQADDDGEVAEVSSDFVKVKKADGSIRSFDLYVITVLQVPKSIVKLLNALLFIIFYINQKKNFFKSHN